MIDQNGWERVVTARLRAAGCVFAEDEAAVLLAAAAEAHDGPSVHGADRATPELPEHLETMVRRRCDGEPLEVIVGWADFCGLRIPVVPGVFVPRRRSEALVRRALAVCPVADPIVVDLCCGSGALAAGFAAQHPGRCRIWATDIDPVAVGCAERTLRPFGATVATGDLFQPLPSRLRGQVHVLLANVPYVPSDALRLLPAEARVYEPAVALDGGGDGLDLARRVAAQAPEWLAPGGSLVVETDDRQASLLAAVMAQHGLLAAVHSESDEAATVVTGTRRGGAATAPAATAVPTGAAPPAVGVPTGTPTAAAAALTGTPTAAAARSGTPTATAGLHNTTNPTGAGIVGSGETSAPRSGRADGRAPGRVGR